MKNIFDYILTVLRGFYLYTKDDHFNKEMKSFYFANKEYWGEDKNSNSDRICLVDSFHCTPSYIMQVGRIAKLLKKEKGTKTIVLINIFSRKFSDYVKLYSSFNIKNFINNI
jgi:hypothetical protein